MANVNDIITKCKRWGIKAELNKEGNWRWSLKQLSDNERTSRQVDRISEWPIIAIMAIGSIALLWNNCHYKNITVILTTTCKLKHEPMVHCKWYRLEQVEYEAHDFQQAMGEESWHFSHHPTKEMKLLGATFQDSLSWDSHVKNICKTASQRISRPGWTTFFRWKIAKLTISD